MKTCQNCGAAGRDEAKFCNKCGTAFPLPGAEPAVKTPAPPPGEAAPPAWTQQPAPAEQPPVAEAPAPPTYGYPQQQPQQPQQAAPPTYGYPPQQPQQPQQAAPPTYGYPPQQPQQPQQAAPPTYGYPPQQPQQPQQGTPAYGYPPQAPMAPAAPKPKKKRPWLIPVIALGVVAAIVLGSVFIFGDQIKNLFSSPEKRWLNAEKALITIDENTIYDTARDALNKQVNQTKFGGEMVISVDVKGSANAQLAGILDALGKLRLQASYMTEKSEDGLRFQTQIGVSSRENESGALTAKIYTVDENLVIDASPILEKPLVLRAQTLQQMMNNTIDISAMLKGGSSDLTDALKSFAKILSAPEKIGGEVLDLIAKHAEKPVVEKGQELKVGGLSQKLDRYKVVLKAENAPKMFKDVISYIRDNEEIRELVTALGTASGSFTAQMPGRINAASFTYEDFVNSMNQALDQLEKNPDQFKNELERELYIDSKGQPHGGRLIIKNAKDNTDLFTIEHLLVEADGKFAYRFSAQPAGQSAIIFTSEYTLKDQRYTGKFELTNSQNGNDVTFLTGSMEGFGLEGVDGYAYPVGKLVLDISSLNPRMPGMSMPGSNVPMSGATVTYDGKVEKKENGSHLLASVEFAPQGQNTGFSSINVSFDLRAIPEKDIKLETEMPADFIEITDQESFAMIVQNDPGFMVRLMQALAALGIDASQFMPGPGIN
ncbi:MAG: zinc ribbon domain-containing protein [Bacillota bacterium]|nr:zinc ribbon domain-containing protein [Bacillota bacterium]